MPTVVLLPPLDQTCAHFDDVMALLPPTLTAVRVERPRQRADARAVRGFVDDLADLDEAVRGHDAPMVMVGASYGGLLARAFAGRRRTRVRGVVLVDAVHEETYDSVLDVVGAEAGEVLVNGEGLDLPAAMRQAKTMLDADGLGDLPMVVLSRERLRDDELAVSPQAGVLDQVWLAHQERLAACSSRARWAVVPGSGHFIARDAPAAVAAAVQEVAAVG